MIYVESALEQLRNSFDSSGLRYELGELDEKRVEINVVKNGVEVRTWFDVEKQIYGFNMIQGGCKTYGSIEDFEKFFATYLAIHTDFLPSAKAVADVFEKEVEVSSIYDNFSGNKQSGYIAQFRVLGQEDNLILISKTPEGYTAKYGNSIEDGSKFKILVEYKYEVDEVGNVSVIPTIHSYIHELSVRYKDNDQVDIERIGVDEFTYTIEGLTIRAKVVFMYRDVKYVVSDIGGYSVDFECSLDDYLELSALFMVCKDKYDDLTCCEDEVASEDDEEVEVYEPSYEEQEHSMGNGVAEGFEVPEEPMEEKEEVAQGMEFSIKAIVASDNSVRALQFITDDGIYTMSVDKAKELGIPVDRIDERVSCVRRRGILITEDELALRSFSQDISDNVEMCQRLFDSIFE